MAALTTGCGGDSDNEPVLVNGCSAQITSVNVVQNNDRLDFTVNATPGALYYEASIVQTGNTLNPEHGQIIALNFETNSLSLADYFFEGDFVVYIRTVCPDGTKGAWSSPKLITITDFCASPYGFSVLGPNLYWSMDDFNSEVQTYQVQYGPQGFALGQGTSVTVNTTHFGDAVMQAGQAYDFYVRAYCANNVGFGNWAGPFTHFSESNQNMCLPPTNLTVSFEYWAQDYKLGHINWQGNGEQQFEYVLVTNNNTPESGSINTTTNTAASYSGLYVWTDYDFYVRAVCSNGNRTAWVKLDVNP